ncbi:unnamed protein product [Phytophthora lilii]|uniref:Unnamed protein product n=1 Tax=Phytophthora lilii TaxID=2077276 RepID=A0A9W6U076_9STRA|nr:unnamed protein product [Phytophthora lilii]
MGVLRASCALAAAAALGAGQTAAYKIFQEKLPNGGNVPGVMALGHDRPDSGGPNNDFGLDFIGAMFKWTKEFCEKDSDGDGQTNGQELGDPCCEFEHRVHEQVRWTEGVSHPGDAAFTSDPKLWEGIVCGAAEPAAAAQEAAEPEDAEQKTQEKTEQETQEETVQAVQKAEQDDASEQEAADMYAVVAAVAVFAAVTVPQTAGYSMYALRVPNGDKVPGVTALGHVDPVLAGPMNEFGMDMIDADFHWTKEFCMKDSDGDGQTNGQELGDPCCEFVYRKNAVVRWTEGVSHPGDASLKSDPKLWKGIVCEIAAEPANASATAGETKTEEAAKEAAAVETTTQAAAVQAETVTEDTEEPVKVSSQKTEGANETAEEEAEATAKDATGAAPALVSSSILSAVVVLGLLGFVVVRMRSRRSQWTLLPQQSRRTHVLLNELIILKGRVIAAFKLDAVSPAMTVDNQVLVHMKVSSETSSSRCWRSSSQSWSEDEQGTKMCDRWLYPTATVAPRRKLTQALGWRLPARKSPLLQRAVAKQQPVPSHSWSLRREELRDPIEIVDRMARRTSLAVAAASIMLGSSSSVTHCSIAVATRFTSTLHQASPSSTPRRCSSRRPCRTEHHPAVPSTRACSSTPKSTTVSATCPS